MRTALALVVVLGAAASLQAQTGIIPANTLQVTVSGNPQFNGTVTCQYVGNGVNNHSWIGAMPPASGAYAIRVGAGAANWAPPGLPPEPNAFITVSIGTLLPSGPWQIRTTNLNGPTWNESAGGTSAFSIGTVTVRGM